MLRIVSVAALALTIVLPVHAASSGADARTASNEVSTDKAQPAADETVVRSVNGLIGDVVINGGPNVTVSRSGTGLLISATDTPGPQGPAGPKGSAGATGPQGVAGPTGPQGAQGVVAMKFASSSELVEVTASHVVLSITVDVPVTGQKIWVQATASAQFTNHSGVNMHAVVKHAGTSHSSVVSTAVNQIAGSYQMNTVNTLSNALLTPPLTAGTWTINVVAARVNGCSHGTLLTERTLTVMVLNP
jgi:hypothetical protein